MQLATETYLTQLKNLPTKGKHRGEHVTFEGSQKIIALGKRQEARGNRIDRFLDLKKTIFAKLTCSQ